MRTLTVRFLISSLILVGSFSVSSFAAAQFAQSPEQSDFTNLSADLKVNGSDGPVIVQNKDRIVLSWSSEGADYCKGSWAKTQLKDTSGKQSGRITKSIKFTLTCYDGNGDRETDSVVVNVAGLPPIATPPTPTGLGNPTSPSTGVPQPATSCPPGQYLMVNPITNVPGCNSFVGVPPILKVTSQHNLTLAVGELGRWDITVSDADGDSLMLAAKWRDGSPDDHLGPTVGGGSSPQYTSFVHSFSKSGVYIIDFLALDSTGKTSVVSERITVTDAAATPQQPTTPIPTPGFSAPGYYTVEASAEPPQRIIAPGTPDVTLGIFKFLNGGGNDLLLKQIALELVGAPAATLVDKSVSFWQNSTKIGEMMFTGANGHNFGTSTLLANVRIPAHSSIEIKVLGSIGGYDPISGPITTRFSTFLLVYDGDNVGINGNYAVDATTGKNIPGNRGDVKTNVVIVDQTATAQSAGNGVTGRGGTSTTGKPNLIAFAPEFSGSSAGGRKYYEGENTISSSVQNAGDGAANGTFQSKFQFSPNDGNNWYDWVSPQSITNLAAGASRTVSYTWTAGIGTYSFRLCVDTGYAIAESSENDNCSAPEKAEFVPKGTAATAQAAPTLSSLTPSQTTAGTSVLLSGTGLDHIDSVIINGPGVDTGTKPDSVQVGGGKLYFTLPASLRPGTYAISVTKFGEPGSNTLGLTIIGTAATTPTTQTQTTAEASVMKAGKPNLVASDLALSGGIGGGKYVGGGRTDITGTVYNRGGDEGVRDTVTKFQYSPNSGVNWYDLSAEQAEPSIPAGGSAKAGYYWTTGTSGTYSFRLCADTANNVTETDESDNCSATLSAEFVPTSTQASTAAPLSVSCNTYPLSVSVGSPISWGASPSGGTGSYSFSWSGTDGFSAGNIPNASFAYSSSGVKSVSVTVTSGSESKTISCSATVTDAASQTAAANTTPPSLSISAPNVTGDSAGAGQLYPGLTTISAVVTNSGGPSADTVTPKFQYSPNDGANWVAWVDGSPVSNLGAGAAQTSSYSWQTGTGTYSFRACLDSACSSATKIQFVARPVSLFSIRSGLANVFEAVFSALQGLRNGK